MIADLPSLSVLERTLKHRIGAHPKRILQGQVSGKGGQALPESANTFGARNRGAAVDNSLVGAGPVQLEPGLDDVDGLQTRSLHDPPERTGQGLDVRRDGPLGWTRRRIGAFILVFFHGFVTLNLYVGNENRVLLRRRRGRREIRLSLLVSSSPFSFVVEVDCLLLLCSLIEN